LKKGSLVYVEGRIQSREWQDKEGQKRTSHDIVANVMRMLGSRAESAMGASAAAGGGASADFDSQAAPAAEDHPAAGPEISDEDIPF